MKMSKMIENINNLVKTNNRYRKGNIPGVAQCKNNAFVLAMGGNIAIGTFGMFVNEKGEPFKGRASK